MLNDVVAVNPLDYMRERERESITRGPTQMFIQPCCRTKVYQVSFFPPSAMLWNLLLVVVRATPLDAFQSRVGKLTQM